MYSLFFKVDGNEQTSWLYSHLLIIKGGGWMSVFFFFLTNICSLDT